jgi:hypothetical protein
MNFRYAYIISTVVLLISTSIYAQDDINDILEQEVENWNPVYKPVIGLGVGAFNFLGDVRNPEITPFNGTLGYKLNVATFLDNKHYVRANFVFMYGQLTGNERSFSDLSRNLNFKTDILLFGVNLNYDFDNFYKTYRKVHPFISVGLETFTFDSKIDSFANGIKYNYWDDGGIRTLPQNEIGSEPMTRDYIYETPLRQYDWGLGKYPQYSFAIPIDAGIDFQVSDRVMFRVAASYHLTFTDVIDHVSHKNRPSDPEIPDNAVVGDKRNDDFLYTYFSIHLDLFSSDKTLKLNKLWADLEWDNTLMGDEDGDGAFDGYDNCPHTPFGVETDTLGCPLDNDFDGIPNYMDDEPNSRYGAMVDERGVELSDEDIIKRLDMSDAVLRKDIADYIRTPSSYANYKKRAYNDIPEKFRKIDSNQDGYISFDEMMNGVDSFFDFDSELNTDDIYELNEFFFSQ